MRPGVVGTALLVVAGCAAGGALYARDDAQVKRAREARDEGLRLLASGDVAAAGRAFQESSAAAGQVSGLFGRRAEALSIADAARAGESLLGALAQTQTAPLEALRILGSATEPPPAVASAVQGIQAALLLDAALTLERQGAVTQARQVYDRAVDAARATASPRLPEAERGRDRAALLCDLSASEAALTAGQEEEAGRLAEAARTTLAQSDSPFEPERAAELSARIERILAEVQSGRLLGDYARAVEELARKVPGPELGTLLPAVERLKPPPLPGGHPHAQSHAERLGLLRDRQAKIRETAAAFQGMVLATRSGKTLVFIDRTEVTNQDFAAFVQAGGYTKEELWSEEGRRRLPRFRDATRKLGPSDWSGGAPPAAEVTHPVRGISYFEAEAYARWRGKRLPTLAEWQSAAASGKSAYPWGDAWVDRQANVGGSQGASTQPVGSYPEGRGPTGALDMIGNVREIVRLPEDAYAAVGGSFRSLPEHSTVNSKVALSASVRASDTGFRCAKELQWDG